MAFINLWGLSNSLVIFLIFSWFSTFWAKDYSISITSFKHSISSYFYFDNSTKILLYSKVNKEVWRSENEGTSWVKIKDIPSNKAKMLVKHPFNNTMAFILGDDTTHYYTLDQGITWNSFKTQLPFIGEKSPLSFNSAKYNYIIYIGAQCKDSNELHCIFNAYYTEDAFSTSPKILKENVKSCMFVKSSKEFVNCSDKLVFCTYMDLQEKNSNLYLIKSDNWFSTYTHMNFDGKPLVNLNGFGTIQTFVIVVVKTLGDMGLEMHVSKDGDTWSKAKFPHFYQKNFKENSYTILESQSYSLQIDILAHLEYPHYGGISFKSDISGIYFTPIIEHTNRNEKGYIDFENVQFIDGIILANIIENWREINDNANFDKKIQSRISFDNGYTWNYIKPPNNSNCNIFDFKLCSLHLHSVTDKHKHGRVFSNYAPGLLIAIGSVGPYLRPYNECDLFVSEDAGKTWSLSLKGIYKYEWTSHGGIIAAIPEGKTRNFYFSVDRGRQWNMIDLGVHVYPLLLITAPNSRTGKFMVISSKYDKDNSIHGSVIVISVDLSKIYTKKCIFDKVSSENNDLEKWYTSYNNKSEPECLMGRKQYFWRKKIGRKCFVEENHIELQAIEEHCACSDNDYECDYNFIYNNNKCIEHIPQEIPQDQCKNPNDVFLGSSGYRKIPGNTCDDKYGIMKDKKVEISCKKNNHSNNIIIKLKNFKGTLVNYYYLKKNINDPNDKNDLDETILLLTSEMELYVSHDQGNEWDQVLQDEHIISIFQNTYANEQVYFLGMDKKGWVTYDRCNSIHKITLPVYSHLEYSTIEFHPDDKNWIIFTGCNENEIMGDCNTVSYYSTNGGDSWNILMSNTRSCSWIKSNTFNANKNLIYCEIFSPDLKKSPLDPVKLIYSIDFFQSYTVLFDSIMGYVRFEEFIILAELDSITKTLKPYVSLNGLDFVHAKFPSHYSGLAYTILDSTTKSIFLHITINGYKGFEWGSILKSNSNGTNFVKVLDLVNRDNHGYVDYERLKGLEGVSISNIIINPDDILRGASKRIKTVITYNDGGEWFFLTPPQKDSNGNRYCSGSLEKCSLNLHGYSERIDFRNTFSSNTIPGLDFAVGNVGEYLNSYLDCNTFMTTDGGVTWKEVLKGPYMWKFGDQGSILLLTRDKDFSDYFYYSLDLGNTWEKFYFPNRELFLVYDITTVYSDTSRKFVLFSLRNKGGNILTTIYIDFTMLTTRKCELIKESPDKSDFELWNFKHPKKENLCLFGHIKDFYRKKPDRKCFVGKDYIEHIISKNCTCQLEDYECDYNYERASDGSCELVKGLHPLDHLKECEDPNVIVYYEPTGYRRIPLTTCQGGKELDKNTVPIPCPGKESEYRKLRKRLHGFELFLIIISPFIIIIFSGYCMWFLYRDKFLGQIRLGEDETPSGWIQYPLILINKITALFFIIKNIISYGINRLLSSFSRYSHRYNSRNSFSRNNYSILLPNNPELFYDDFEN